MYPVGGDEHVDSYLRADPRLKCGDGDLSDLESGHGFHWDSEYTFMWWYSVSFTLVYPIGIPTLYFVLLYTNRDLIAPTPAIPADGQRTEPIVAAQLRLREANAQRIAHLRFLIDSYEPGSMYFEVVECVRKLMLTGMLIFFFPGTPSQVRARSPRLRTLSMFVTRISPPDRHRRDHRSVERLHLLVLQTFH